MCGSTRVQVKNMLCRLNIVDPVPIFLTGRNRTTDFDDQAARRDESTTTTSKRRSAGLFLVFFGMTGVASRVPLG